MVRGAGLASLLAPLKALAWLLSYWGLPIVDSSRAVSHVVLVAITLLLTIGMSWSHVTRRLSGQVDMDEVD